MKKDWFRRAVISGLAVTLAAGGLTACGGSGADKEKNALVKEYVYSFQEYSIPDLGGDYTQMLSSFEAEGRVYALMQVEHYSEEYYTSYHLLSFMEDGSDVKNLDLEVNETVVNEEEMNAGDASGDDTGAEASDEIDIIMPRAEVNAHVEDTDIDIDIDEDIDEDIDADMSVDGDPSDAAAADNASPADVADDFPMEDVVLPDEDMWQSPDTWEYTSLQNLTYGSGAVYGTRHYNFQNYTTGFSLEKRYLCCWNLDGTVRWETELKDLQDMWIQTIAAASDGTLTILLSGEESYICSVSADGEMKEQRPMSDDVGTALERCWMLEPMENGKFFVAYTGVDDWTKMFVAEYDPVANSISDSVQIPTTIFYSYNGMMKTGKQSDLIYSTSSGLYTYNVGDEEGTKIMDYVNSDLYITSLQDVIQLDDTRFVGMFYENYDRSKLKAGLFTHIPPEDIPDKKAMVLAGMWVDGDIRQRVIEFNRNSQEYRITIRDYSEYNSYEDYEAGQTRLNNDMITGNMPDILVANGNLPVSNYIAKGWLADINSFIKKDEELSQEEFLQNVFDAYSVKGKLYYVIPSFSVSTMAAKTSIVGDRTSWSMKDMMELQKTLPEGTRMMGYMNRGSFIYQALQYCGNDFIDVDTGKCSFDSEAFLDLMEYAKSLPEEVTYDDDYWMNYESQYRENKNILMDIYLSSISRFNYTLNGMFGEDISYIGFPSASGMGAYVNYSVAYCISSKSRNQDGAWQFLRYYLTDEYQESDKRYNFSVQKDAFEEEAQEALGRPYWTDVNGEKQEYDDYFTVNGETFVLEPMTQEQIDKLVNYIYTVDNAYYYNTDIINIIQEEIEAYFTDQKDAAEVANIIQRRAQVYVDENR